MECGSFRGIKLLEHAMKVVERIFEHRIRQQIVIDDMQFMKGKGTTDAIFMARGMLVVHGTSGSTSYEMIPHVQLEISGDVLSTADMVVQRRDGPRRLREIDDDDGDMMAEVLWPLASDWWQVLVINYLIFVLTVLQYIKILVNCS